MNLIFYESNNFNRNNNNSAKLKLKGGTNKMLSNHTLSCGDLK
jgi:hypothetical protein